MTDLNRLRRLAGLLTESENDPATQAILDQACDCGRDTCTECNPVTEEILEGSIQEAYRKFMMENFEEDVQGG